MSTTTHRSTSSRRSIFLRCFGYSGDKMQVKDKVDKVNSTSRRRRWQWLFSCKKPSVKSVHVDFTPTDRKPKTVNETKVTKHVATTSEEQKWTDVIKGQKSQKTQTGSFRSRRKDVKPVATSATGAGDEIKKTSNPYVSSPMKALTQSKSLKPTNQVEHKTTPLGGGEFDFIIAMLILLTIMVIMMLWGKLCAIFCTCAWFVIAPRVMAAGVGTAERRLPELVDDINMNLESVEYKKKVVLEGLLQRNHRNHVVGRL